MRFWCLCTLRTIISCKMTAENFVRNVRTVFEKFVKSSKLAVFLGHFWTTFDYVCQITVKQFWWHCTQRTLKKCRMTVENFVRSHWRFLEKIEGVHNWPFPGHFGAISILFFKQIHTILVPLQIKDSNLVQKHYRIFSSNREDSFWETKSATSVFFGHFGDTFGCLSDHRHTILMPLHTENPSMV